jgi:adenine-specific DNA-methyltransferase
MSQCATKYPLPALPEMPAKALGYPQLRFMGSKSRLLPWIHEIVAPLEFDSALDAFSGSGCVSYLFKTMGKEVVSNDFLKFTHQLAVGCIENPGIKVSDEEVSLLLRARKSRKHFIADTFTGIFFTPADLDFLDVVWSNIPKLDSTWKKALVISALVRGCAKKQPRGVFTVSGDLSNYDDGRRDLRLSLHEHFQESLRIYNSIVFDNGRNNRALNGNALDVEIPVDLVYMDPPYVPRADDNCYIKRYHFLEGLATYWEGLELMQTSKVKKLPKRHTPFSHRKSAVEAFDAMFRKFADSTLVLSYSSNGFPDLEVLTKLMKQYKPVVEVFEKDHRYHFGTHAGVNRALVKEYLILGLS